MPTEQAYPKNQVPVKRGRPNQYICRFLEEPTIHQSSFALAGQSMHLLVRSRAHSKILVFASGDMPPGLKVPKFDLKQRPEVLKPVTAIVTTKKWCYLETINQTAGETDSPP
ncbi:hypothetical protein AVEN_121916-1 [Araneus ventricosus]|uniref:Uncharacterized protein n=1 Tax=Araneus ventricosus TaxID=182803 RepID=A0A4Y2J4D6_ARAVE|nr:hypothetical protein AVEN_121916-1 [Araneus ventricosus]